MTCIWLPANTIDPNAIQNGHVHGTDALEICIMSLQNMDTG